MHLRFVALGALALSLVFLLGARPASAQTPVPVATPVVLPTLPPQSKLDPYAKAAIDLLTGAVNRQIQNIGNSTTGQVSYFKRFEMQVRTGTNSYRSIHLHQGTVINPTGRSLSLGQTVQVSGATQADGSLAADVITIDQ